MTDTSHWRYLTRLAKPRHTRPERFVRSILHALGYRFRVQGDGPPGTPDIFFPSGRKAIFVHGCFWHGHDCLPPERRPQTNTAYWTDKIARNTARHERQVCELEADDWNVLTLWECEILDVLSLAILLHRFLGDTVHHRRSGARRARRPGSET